MNFKYYDLLSNLTTGVIALFVIWHCCFPLISISEWVVLPAGYVVGFFLNSFASLIEPVLFKTICGKPSDKLLTPIPGQNWTGTKKIRFYFAKDVIGLLRKDTGDDDASPDKMFGYAMNIVNGLNDSRVSDFNGHYAMSRAVFASILVSIVFVEICYYYVWYSWVVSIVLLLLAWNRFKEYGYYYAKEVLSVYLKMRLEDGKTSSNDRV